MSPISRGTLNSNLTRHLGIYLAKEATGISTTGGSYLVNCDDA